MTKSFSYTLVSSLTTCCSDDIRYLFFLSLFLSALLTYSTFDLLTVFINTAFNVHTRLGEWRRKWERKKEKKMNCIFTLDVSRQVHHETTYKWIMYLTKRSIFTQMFNYTSHLIAIWFSITYHLSLSKLFSFFLLFLTASSTIELNQRTVNVIGISCASMTMKYLNRHPTHFIVCVCCLLFASLKLTILLL